VRWGTFSGRDHVTDIHVIPIADLRGHGESRSCWCKPELRQVRHEDGRKAGVTVHHHAMDGRDLIERYGLM